MDRDVVEEGVAEEGVAEEGVVAGGVTEEGAAVTGAEEADDPQPGVASDHGSTTAAPHPEEMRATIDLRIGNTVSMSATARATPAGFITAAVLVSAILVPLVLFARRRRMR
jgi:hypothetical protein